MAIGKSAANVGYVSSKVNTAKGDVTVGLKTYFDTKIKESHITAQPIKTTFSGISWKMPTSHPVETI